MKAGEAEAARGIERKAFSSWSKWPGSGAFGGAGLMVRTLARLWSSIQDSTQRNVLTFGVCRCRLRLIERECRNRKRAFSVNSRRIRTAPGVQAVSMSWAALPMRRRRRALFWFDGQRSPQTQNDMKWAVKYVVEPDYLKVMENSARARALLHFAGQRRRPVVAVVDEIFAQKIFWQRRSARETHPPHENEGMGTELSKSSVWWTM